MNVRIKDYPRPPLAATPYDGKVSGDTLSQHWETAVAVARRRSVERDCRQQVRRFHPKTTMWVIQDIR